MQLPCCSRAFPARGPGLRRKVLTRALLQICDQHDAISRQGLLGNACVCVYVCFVCAYVSMHMYEARPHAGVFLHV